MNWSLAVIFLLGIGNFVLHGAILHRAGSSEGQLPGFVRTLSVRLTLVAEFLVLLLAMALAANGWAGLVWAYAGYTGLNALSAWFIMGRRF